ncbi:MAG: carboxypeptidase-like regulatory domain-containing protein [Pirellulaceae bacterium]
MQAYSRFLLASLAGLMLGCSSGPVADYSKLGLVEISGTVTLDGTPIAGAAVMLMDAEERYSFGVTDSTGKYRLMLNSEKSGVVPGEKRVEISTTRNPLGEGASSGEQGELEEEGDPDASPAKSTNSGEKIPACYNSKSKLRVTITESDSALDFDLKSDCSTTAAT